MFVLVLLQECHSVLAKYENVFLLQVGRLLQIGGLWTSPALQAILSESSLPQNEGTPSFQCGWNLFFIFSLELINSKYVFSPQWIVTSAPSHRRSSNSVFATFHPVDGTARPPPWLNVASGIPLQDSCCSSSSSTSHGLSKQISTTACKKKSVELNSNPPSSIKRSVVLLLSVFYCF